MRLSEITEALKDMVAKKGENRPEVDLDAIVEFMTTIGSEMTADCIFQDGHAGDTAAHVTLECPLGDLGVVIKVDYTLPIDKEVFVRLIRDGKGVIGWKYSASSFVENMHDACSLMVSRIEDYVEDAAHS